MKRTLLALLLLGVAYAQPLDYAACKAKAEQLMSQHKLEVGQGVPRQFDHKDKAALAGEAWLEAAHQTQGVQLRFQALEQAVLAFDASRNSLGEKSRIQALTEARDLVGAPEEGRARLGLRLAYITRTPEDFTAVGRLTGGAPETRGEAYDALGSSYLTKAKSEPKLYGNIVEAYEKSAAAFAEANEGRAIAELGMARLKAESIPDKKAALAAVDRICKTELAYKSHQSPLGQAMVRLRWADSLEKLGAVDRAQALRRELGKLASAPADQREEAWVKAADAELKRSRAPQALKDLEQARIVRADNFVFSQRVARKQIAVLNSLKKLDEVAKIWAGLAAHPKAVAQQRDECRLEQAAVLRELKRHGEADKLLDGIIAQPGSAAILAEACQIRLSRRVELKQYEAALQDLAKYETRFNAAPLTLLDIRGTCLARLGRETEAFDYWDKLHTDRSGVVLASRPMVDSAEEVFHGHLAAKRLAPALALRKRIEKWAVQPILFDLWDAEYAVAAGDKAAAGTAIEKARRRLAAFPAAGKAQLEKRIADLEGKKNAL